jgi:O-antigen/teichoic acid export membrane protein
VTIEEGPNRPSRFPGFRSREYRAQLVDRIRKSVPRLRQSVGALREDRLGRTSFLLVADSLFLGAMGGLFVVIATHLWEPRSIGVVAAIVSANGLIVIAAGLGMPDTIVANLAKEPDQALMVRGALSISLPVGLALITALWLVPGHVGVPLDKLGVSTPWAVTLTVLFVTASLIGIIIDPAFLARQEVSWTVGKDLTSMVVRYLALFLLAGSRTVGYFEVAVIYVIFAACVDLVLVRRRLSRAPRARFSAGLKLVRPHAGFAAGNQVAVLVAVLPPYLLPIIVLSRLGAASAAYVAIPTTIFSVLTVVPSMTAQSLFAEMSAHPEVMYEPIRKALRGAYIVTLPLAAVTIIVAPYLLNLFGHGYSLHGSDFLRWGAASAIFFCFNYVSDIVLLARKLVKAYVLANVAGTCFVLLSLFIGVRHGLGALGIAWFVGQACYCAVSCIVLAHYTGTRNLLTVVRSVFSKGPGLPQI